MWIETNRLIVRDFRAEDVHDLHEILGDEETMENCEPAYDFEKTQQFLAEFCIGKKGGVAAALKDSDKDTSFSSRWKRAFMRSAGSSTEPTGGRGMPMRPARR